MIRIETLNKHYNNGKVQALKDINVSIRDGEFVAIIGSSGAGKSTFLRAINRLIEPADGSHVFIDDTEITGLNKNQLIKIRRRIGFIFQQFNLVEKLTVLQNVLTGRIGFNSVPAMMLGLFSQKDIEIATHYIREVGLIEKLYTRSDNLSGGQQQRVAIARAMAQEPSIILADEPMASLDPKLSHVILGLLKKFNKERGITVLVNLHVLELATQYADRILGFRLGEMVFDGTPEQLDSEHIEHIYSAKVE
ncbi:phosphonate ABC transporter ATP-binding protein [bacterium]|nr:phosphonate ABC transporter ATP-binding protein [bacterium]